MATTPKEPRNIAINLFAVTFSLRKVLAISMVQIGTVNSNAKTSVSGKTPMPKNQPYCAIK